MPFRCASVLLLRSYYPSPWAGLGLLRFRSPLLPESLLFSFPPGTQMFHFPGFSSLSGCTSPLRDAGFPIRTPPDPRSPTAPRRVSPFNASFFFRHVPRHPPYALSILIYRVFFRRLLSLRFLFLRFAFELFFPFRTVFSFNLAFLVQKDHVCLFSICFFCHPVFKDRLP